MRSLFGKLVFGTINVASHDLNATLAANASREGEVKDSLGDHRAEAFSVQ